MIARGRWLRRVGLGVLSSVALLPLLPLLSTWCPASWPLERGVAWWFNLHCHREPARTPFVLGVPLGVCARCWGIYLGLGFGVALRVPRLPSHALRRWLVGAASLMLLDILLELHHLHGAWMLPRLLTGTLLAYPVGVRLGELVTRTQSQRP